MPYPDSAREYILEHSEGWRHDSEWEKSTGSLRYRIEKWYDDLEIVVVQAKAKFMGQEVEQAYAFSHMTRERFKEDMLFILDYMYFFLIYEYKYGNAGNHCVIWEGGAVE